MNQEVTKWNNRYNQSDFVYGVESNEILVHSFSRMDDANKFLCIAQGEGRNAVYLAGEGKDVTAWGFAQEGLNKINELAKKKLLDVKTELIDLTEVTWNEAEWDAVVNIFGHFHICSRERIFEGIKKMIKPGGYFISEVYSTYQLNYLTGGPKKTEMLYQPIKVLEIFQDWKLIEFFVGKLKEVKDRCIAEIAMLFRGSFKNNYKHRNDKSLDIA